MSYFPAPTKAWHTTTYPTLDPTRPELSAKSKNVVVTGGGTGIGAETARHFAKAGASSIAILGRREQPLLDTKAAIEREFPNVAIFAAPTDVTKTAEVGKAFANFLGDRKVDVLFEGIEISLRSAFVVTKTFLQYAADDAVLINVSSIVAHLNFAPGISSYNVNKGAALRFFDTLVEEYPDLCVFNIQPGAVETPMSRKSGYPWRDDISLPASFIVWLASPEARFLKGRFLWANWDVDELKAKAEEIRSSSLFKVDLVGWPFS